MQTEDQQKVQTQRHRGMNVHLSDPGPLPTLQSEVPVPGPGAGWLQSLSAPCELDSQEFLNPFLNVK